MGLLTFSLNVTLDGCVDHQEGIADDETHAFFTRLMDEGGAMLWGRVTYEMMESYWPAVACGDVEAPPAMHEWAVKLEATRVRQFGAVFAYRRFDRPIESSTCGAVAGLSVVARAFA